MADSYIVIKKDGSQVVRTRQKGGGVKDTPVVAKQEPIRIISRVRDGKKEKVNDTGGQGTTYYTQNSPVTPAPQTSQNQTISNNTNPAAISQNPAKTGLLGAQLVSSIIAARTPVYNPSRQIESNESIQPERKQSYVNEDITPYYDEEQIQKDFYKRNTPGKLKKGSVQSAEIKETEFNKLEIARTNLEKRQQQLNRFASKTRSSISSSSPLKTLGDVGVNTGQFIGGALLGSGKRVVEVVKDISPVNPGYESGGSFLKVPLKETATGVVQSVQYPVQTFKTLSQGFYSNPSETSGRLATDYLLFKSAEPIVIKGIQKGVGYVRTVGMKELPEGSIESSQSIQGGYPSSRLSPDKLIEYFKKTPYQDKLRKEIIPEEPFVNIIESSGETSSMVLKPDKSVGGFSAGDRFPDFDVLGKPKLPDRGTDTAATQYFSPGLSRNFLRLGRSESSSGGVALFPKIGLPTITYATFTKGIGRFPKEIIDIAKKDFKAANLKVIDKYTGSGDVKVSLARELGKMEDEVVSLPGSGADITGQNYFYKVEGVRVPIVEADIIPGKYNPSTVQIVSRGRLRSGESDLKYLIPDNSFVVKTVPALSQIAYDLKSGVIKSTPFVDSAIYGKQAGNVNYYYPDDTFSSIKVSEPSITSPVYEEPTSTASSSGVAYESIIGGSSSKTGSPSRAPPPSSTVIPPSSSILPPTSSIIPPSSGIYPPSSTVIPPSRSILPPSRGYNYRGSGTGSSYTYYDDSGGSFGIIPGFYGKASKGSSKAYDVFVRKKGKFTRANTFPLTKLGALGKGIQISEESALASFKIVETSGKPKEINMGFNVQDRLLRYRKPIRRGSELKSSPIYIEKNKYRINTPGEYEQISRKGQLTSKRKSRFKLL